MQEYSVDVQTTYTVPATATKLTVTHEWGDIVVTNDTVVGGGTYNFTPNSIGVYKFAWKIGTTPLSTQHFSIVKPLVSSAEFLAEYPQWSSRSAEFTALEKRIRVVIENYTGQRFGPYVNKSRSVPGDGGDTLELPVRLTALTSVIDNYGDDRTNEVEVAAGSNDYLEYQTSLRHIPGHDIKRDITLDRRDYFSHRYDFTIVGNWGWEFIPTDVTEAAKLLIHDEYSGQLDLRKHGITEAELGDYRYRLSSDFAGTTGNMQADLLLSQFILINLGLA